MVIWYQHPKTRHFLADIMFDKLVLKAPLSLDFQSLQLRAKCLGMTVKDKRFKDGKFYKIISRDSHQFEIQYNTFTNKAVCIQANPSKWPNLRMFSLDLRNLCDQDISGLEIRRLDLAIDIELPIPEVLKSIDFKYKRKFTRYQNVESSNDGISVGCSRAEQFVIYDKNLERKRARKLDEVKTEPWTRIESRLKGKFLPSRTFADLEGGHYSSIDAPIYASFKKIQWADITFLDRAECTTRKEVEKLGRLKGLCETQSYFLAKKYLNRFDNFQRDYGHLFTRSHSPVQPVDILYKSINRTVGF